MDDAIETVWEAQPGPQTALLTCPVDEVCYGGARGGGKTDGVLGEFASHAQEYGRHAIGLMVRRQSTELVETIERSKTLYLPLGATYNEQKKMWTFPNGARLRFAYLERDADAGGYQGHSYCVAVGTRIRMADGSFRPIETIGTGDMVATLEGPRRVTATVAPYQAPCVRALVRDENGELVGKQVHPVWHPVLTTAGLIWSGTSRIHHTAEPVPSVVSARGRQVAGFPCDEDRAPSAWYAWKADDQTDCKGSLRSRRGALPPQSLTVPVVLHALSVRSVNERGRAAPAVSSKCHAHGRWPEQCWGSLRDLTRSVWGRLRRLVPAQLGLDHSCLAPANAGACGRNGFPSTPDFPADYHGEPYSDGAPALSGQGSGQVFPPSPADAENTPLAWLSGELGTTPSHSQTQTASWVHPYSGEVRHLSEAVMWGTMELTECGLAWVADLSVEGANHYISDCGLINKNTRVYIEEAGNFPSPTPIFKLMGTLRSGAGVPCRMILTCNPGGVGHQWVKARYITPAPLGYQVITDIFTNPFTGAKVPRTRVFIPSLVTDNKFLGESYIATLQQTGNDNLVKAWLLGDWDIVEGAFFDRWSHRNVVKPFAIPPEWLRFRAADWGYSAPFSMGWYAVAGDDAPAYNLPRGCLVRYREFYAMRPGQPNVGLRLTTEELAERIKEMSKGEKYAYSVIDPAAFAESGGPSIAERFARAGVEFRRGDNRRLGARGAMGGWDMVRHRINGEDEAPMFVTFSTCVDLIRTLPILQHDPDRPEDLDTKQEDHAADECRYACMSRPWVPKAKPVDPKPRTINELTMNEAWEKLREPTHRGRI